MSSMQNPVVVMVFYFCDQNFEDLDFGDGFLVTLVLVHHLFHNNVQDESKHLRLEASSNQILMPFSFANLEAISKITWNPMMKSTNLEAIDEICKIKPIVA
ncbi:hypothetical protein L6452_07430 [Arctium lappa]|uniref:Uncharacterized protein n=1 Tax=Arctium lappa TaxID=4217 RepID=A0ACB9ELV3_ARCLA|nr:hypothetical protein L6452_07430 [Arctium lappa]